MLTFVSLYSVGLYFENQTPFSPLQPVWLFLQEVMSVEDETTSCYCLMDSHSCHLLLDHPGSYALVGEPLTEVAAKRLKLAAFGSMGTSFMEYSLRVYCVDDTPHAFQVSHDRPCATLVWNVLNRNVKPVQSTFSSKGSSFTCWCFQHERRLLSTVWQLFSTQQDP